MSAAFERFRQIVTRRDSLCYEIVGALKAHVEMLRKDDSPKSAAYSLTALEKYLAKYDAIDAELEAAAAADDAEREQSR